MYPILTPRCAKEDSVIKQVNANKKRTLVFIHLGLKVVDVIIQNLLYDGEKATIPSKELIFFKLTK
jgi:hypothetical protein